jgi:hypothetical protein
MKIRHNKKRNTAFVYEALIREGTAAILKKDSRRKNQIVALLKKHFVPGSTLYCDLECYRSLYENQGLDHFTSEKILHEAKKQKSLIDDKMLFEKQSQLIADVNKTLEGEIFANFVPNYKTLATISQLFSPKVSPRNKVILETRIVANMTNTFKERESGSEIDRVVYNTFVQKFNDKYDGTLLPEQKELLGHYISSFVDNALGLKVFLNEELSRLKEELENAQQLSEIKEDAAMAKKTAAIIGRLQSYAKKGVTEEVLTTVLKTQQLVKEIAADGSSN